MTTTDKPNQTTAQDQSTPGAPPQGDLRTAIAVEENVVSELRRTTFTGTVWFAASVIAAGIPLAGLLAAGWRPSDLPITAEVVWWLGAAIAFVGVAGFGWAGCPILAWELPVAQRQKSICIRGGVALFLVGTVAASVAIVSTPA